MCSDPFYNDLEFKVAGELIKQMNRTPEDSSESINLSKTILDVLNKIPVNNHCSLSDFLVATINTGIVPVKIEREPVYLAATKKLEALGLIHVIVEHGDNLSYAASYTAFKILSMYKKILPKLESEEGCSCEL